MFARTVFFFLLTIISGVFAQAQDFSQVLIPSGIVDTTAISNHFNAQSGTQYQNPYAVSSADGTVVFVFGPGDKRLLSIMRPGDAATHREGTVAILSNRFSRAYSNDLLGMYGMSSIGSAVGTARGIKRALSGAFSGRVFRMRSPDYLTIPGMAVNTLGLVAIDLVGPHQVGTYKIHSEDGRFLILGISESNYLLLAVSNTAAIGVSATQAFVFEGAGYDSLIQALEQAGSYSKAAQQYTLKLLSR